MDNNLHSNAKEFLISITEMKRRKIAFISLEISLFISISISLFDIIMSGLELAIPVMIFFAMVFMLLALKFNKVHDSQACFRIYLSDSRLERDLTDSTDDYLLTDIKSIRIKRTYKKVIREIKFELNNGKTFYINGISGDEFEKLKDDLMNKNIDMQVKTFNEKFVDFDHPLFYPVLGVILGITSSLFLRFMLSADENVIVCVKNVVAFYVMVLGAFFVINRPTIRRYGNKKNLIIKDTIFGTVLIVTGICFYIFM